MALRGDQVLGGRPASGSSCKCVARNLERGNSAGKRDGRPTLLPGFIAGPAWGKQAEFSVAPTGRDRTGRRHRHLRNSPSVPLIRAQPWSCNGKAHETALRGLRCIGVVPAGIEASLQRDRLITRLHPAILVHVRPIREPRSLEYEPRTRSPGRRDARRSKVGRTPVRGSQSGAAGDPLPPYLETRDAPVRPVDRRDPAPEWPGLRWRAPWTNPLRSARADALESAPRAHVAKTRRRRLQVRR
jgi:hypothetical protein